MWILPLKYLSNHVHVKQTVSNAFQRATRPTQGNVFLDRVCLATSTIVLRCRGYPVNIYTVLGAKSWSFLSGVLFCLNLSFRISKGTVHFGVFCSRPVISLGVHQHNLKKKNILNAQTCGFYKRGFMPKVFYYLSEKLFLFQKTTLKRKPILTMCYTINSCPLLVTE